MPSGIDQANDALWSRTDLTPQYVRTDLRPPEVLILVRHRDELSGSVLELGSGAGRVTGYLAHVAGSVHAVDVSPQMVAATAAHVPKATTEVRDLRALEPLGEAAFDAVVAPLNVIDVLDHDDREALFHSLHRLIAPDGLLVFSSHNLAAEARIEDPLRVRGRGPLRALVTLARTPRWRRNRNKLLPLERRESDYAILNDLGHDFQALHYYLTRDTQERQLAEHGFELLECLDLDGTTVEEGGQAAASTELHYVARRVATPATGASS